MIKFKEGDLVYIVVDNSWDMCINKGKILEVRDYDKCLVIKDIRCSRTYKDMFTKRDIVENKLIFKEIGLAQEYLEGIRREEIELYKNEIENVSDLVEFCVGLVESKESKVSKNLAKEAVIERREELGI